MEKVKIEWDEIGQQWVVMNGGNPFRQVYQTMYWNYALQILQSYVSVGYKDVTDYDKTKAIVESWA